MAKLAVLISSPKIWMMHCGVAIGFDGAVLVPGDVWFMLFEHGTVGSVDSTPRSRASCSMVMGMKDPGIFSAYRSRNRSMQGTDPSRRLRKPRKPRNRRRSLEAPWSWWAGCPRPRTEGHGARCAVPRSAARPTTFHRRLRWTQTTCSKLKRRGQKPAALEEASPTLSRARDGGRSLFAGLHVR